MSLAPSPPGRQHMSPRPASTPLPTPDPNQQQHGSSSVLGSSPPAYPLPFESPLRGESPGEEWRAEEWKDEGEEGEEDEEMRWRRGGEVEGDGEGEGRERTCLRGVKEGALRKEGHVFKSWKDRWFVLTDDGLLSYFDVGPLKDRPLGDPLGCVFLNAAKIELTGDEPTQNDKEKPQLLVETQQAKSFLIRAPSWEKSGSAAGELLRRWQRELLRFAGMPYRPPAVVLSPYEPPLPLGESPTVVDGSAVLAAEGSASAAFSLHVEPRIPHGTFRIASHVSLPLASPSPLSASVERRLDDFFRLRDALRR